MLNVQIVNLGRYHSSWLTAEAKEACRGSIVEHTGLFQQWEVWEHLFSKHDEALDDVFPPRTKLDTAAMWHGLKRPGEAFRVDLKASSLRADRQKGHLPQPRPRHPCRERGSALRHLHAALLRRGWG